MEGPDLSQLLEGESSAKPTQTVLDGIVRRHRRLRARRARAAASLALVLAIAGLGVGIGLNGQNAPTHAALGPKALPTTTFKGSSGHSSATATPPRGLSWVRAGSRSSASAGASSPSATHAGSFSSEGSLVQNSPAAYCPEGVCGPVFGSFWPVSGATLTPLFTRSANGVAVRAFTAAWSEPPVVILPAQSGTGSGGSSAGGVAGSGDSGGSVSEPPVTATTVPGSKPSTDTTLPVSTTVPDTDTTTTTNVSSVAGCEVTQALVVEASDRGAVGVVVVPLGPAASQPIDLISAELVGLSEQSPMDVVVTHTDSDVSSVQAGFADGAQDQMSAIDQWAVLVDTPSASTADPGSQTVSVEALASDGSTLEETSVPASGALALPLAACAGAAPRPQYLHVPLPTGGGSPSTVPAAQAKARGAERSGR